MNQGSASKIGKWGVALAAAFLCGAPLVADIPPPPEPEPAPAAPEPAPEPPPRPDWISDAEAKFLDETGGLRPVTSYNSETYQVTIKLMKPGLSQSTVFNRAVGPTYDYYKNTKLVETSFMGKLNGKKYLFTGTVAGKQMPMIGWTQVAFVPAVTTLVQRRNDDRISIEWKKADRETALAMVDANSDRLKEVMAAAGVEDSWEDYREAIADRIDDTQSIWGRHAYYPEKGYYIYEQKVVMQSAMANVIAKVAGEGDIIGAALKVGYQVLGESKMAGASGQPGLAVVDMAGREVSPGR